MTMSLFGCKGHANHPEGPVVDAYIVEGGNWRLFSFSTEEMRGYAAGSIRTINIRSQAIWCTDSTNIPEIRVEATVSRAYDDDHSPRVFFCDSERLYAVPYSKETTQELIFQYLTMSHRLKR